MNEKTHRHIDKRVSDEKMILPVQHHTTWEMTTCLDSSDAWDDGTGGFRDQDPLVLGVIAAQP